jgi:phosphoribosylformylglycinamidine synthase
MNKYNAQIKITLRKGILDVQGKTVEKALHSTEFDMIQNVRIGKYVELEINAGSKEKAMEITRDACNKLIANPIIEDFEIMIENED